MLQSSMKRDYLLRLNKDDRLRVWNVEAAAAARIFAAEHIVNPDHVIA